MKNNRGDKVATFESYGEMLKIVIAIPTELSTTPSDLQNDDGKPTLDWAGKSARQFTTTSDPVNRRTLFNCLV